MKNGKYENDLASADWEKNAYILHEKYVDYPCYDCGNMRQCRNMCMKFRTWSKEAWENVTSVLKRGGNR